MMVASKGAVLLLFCCMLPFVSGTMNWTNTSTLSLSATNRTLFSHSRSSSRVKSTSETLPNGSPSPSSSWSLNETVTPSWLMSHSRTGTSSASTSLSHSLSSSSSLSRSNTISLSPSFSLSLSKSSSFSVSHSNSPSISLSLSPSFTHSMTLTSVTPPPTMSKTVICTFSSSISGSTSISRSATGTNSPTSSRSPSITYSLSKSESVSRSSSISQSNSHSVSLSLSKSKSFSKSASQSRSFSASQTHSIPLTTSPIPPTTTPVPTPTLTWLTACPDTCGHGRCNHEYPVRCVCFHNLITGFWDGGTLDGAPCDRCMPGIYGKNCDMTCPGGSCNPCFRNGVCSDGVNGTGKCTCFQNYKDGFWSEDSDCSECVQGYLGYKCNILCNCSHGDCVQNEEGEHYCKCHNGWGSRFCDQCASGHYGPTCQKCPGMINSTLIISPTVTRVQEVPCYGQGLCSEGLNGDGKCVCFQGFQGVECRLVCGAFCQCETTASCLRCPGQIPSTYQVCSKHGVCLLSGNCQCYEGFTGVACDLVCPNVAGKICNLHGKCFTNTQGEPDCQCERSLQTGFWDGVKCDRCLSTFSGEYCTTPCPLGKLNGLPCAGNGTCVNGACICNASLGVCGPTCELSGNICLPCSPVDRFGRNCDGVCQCVQGDCDNGPLGTGACNCSSGWAGKYCDIECQGGAATPCNFRGKCNLLDGTCQCGAIYAGAACEKQCPFGLHEGVSFVCSKRGDCSSGLNGTGACLCHEHANGTACELCLPGWWGPNCEQFCEGKSVGVECVCDEAHGGPGCSIACPSDSFGNLCGGNGQCSNGSSGTGTCKCYSSFTGPLCNCTNSICGNNQQCDPKTGACVCDEFHKGADCLDCADAFWGYDCTEPCSCRQLYPGNIFGDMHGTCSRTTGACNCYRSPEKGYWDGQTCSKCLEGFFGTQCKQRQVLSSQIVSLSFVDGSTQFNYRSVKLIPDDDFNFLYVIGDLFSAYNTTTILSSKVTVFKQAAKWFDCGMISVAWLRGMNIYFAMLPHTGCRVNTDIYSLPRFSSQSYVTSFFSSNPPKPVLMASISSLGLHLGSKYFYNWNALCTLSLDREQYLFYFKCEFFDDATQTVVPELNKTLSMPAFSQFYGMEYVTHRDSIFLYGTNRDYIRGSMCHGYLVNRQLDAPIDVFASELSSLTSKCLSIEFVVPFAAGLGSLLSVRTPSGPGVLLLPPTIPYHGSLLDIVLTSLSSSYEATAGVLDPFSGVGLISQCQKSTTVKPSCNIVKLFASLQTGVTFLGLQSISPSDRIVDLVTSRNLITYMLLEKYPGTMVRRWLSWDVYSVFPPVADVNGGTPLTIVGSGFRNTDTLMCSVSPTSEKTELDYSNATYINSTMIICPAPRKFSTFYSCNAVEYVEVSLKPGVFSSNRISLNRTATPSVVGANPSQQFLHAPFAMVTITGIGFIDSPVAKCRFGLNASQYSVNLTVTRGIVRSGTVMHCEPPPSLERETPPFWSVAVSIDGFIFSAATAPYVVIGAPAALYFDNNNFFIESQPQTWVPLSIRLVDKEGNAVGDFVDTPYPISLIPSPLSESELVSYNISQTVMPMQQLHGNLNALARNCRATFSTVYLIKPQVTTDKEKFAVSPVIYPPIVYRAILHATGWEDTVTINIEVGDPHFLQLIQEPPAAVSSDGKLTVTPIVAFSDAAGNLLPADDKRVEGLMVQVSVTKELDPEVDVAELQLNKEAEIPNNPWQVNVGNARAVFAGYTLKARSGYRYQMHFVALDEQRHEITSIGNVSSHFIVATCQAAFFRIIGSYECFVCMEHAKCANGTAFVDPGYWIASKLSTEVYRCQGDAETVCPGGEPRTCGSRHTGIMCTDCELGYAKQLGGTCGECLSNGLNLVVIIGIILLITVFLACFVLFTVQNSQQINNITIVVQTYVSHWQTIAIFASLDTPWPGYFSMMIESIDSFADIRILDASFGQCLMTYAGMTFTQKFIFQMLLSAEFVLCAGIARTVLFLFPTALKYLKPDAIFRPKLPITTGRVFGTSALVSLFFLYQALLFYALEMVRCESIDLGLGRKELRLVADPSVDCNSASYQRMKVFAIIIVFFLIFGIPLLIALLYKISEVFFPESRDERFQNWAFFCDGYTRSAWWWPAVHFFRKGVLVSVVVLTGFPQENEFAIWVLVLYLLALMTVRPYSKKTHQHIESIGNVAALVCVNLGTLFHTAPANASWLRILVAPLIILVELITLFIYLVALSKVVRYHLFVWLHLQESDPEPDSEDDIDKGVEPFALMLQGMEETLIGEEEPLEEEEPVKKREESQKMLLDRKLSQRKDSQSAKGGSSVLQIPLLQATSSTALEHNSASRNLLRPPNLQTSRSGYRSLVLNERELEANFFEACDEDI